jgi:hypothetical protein
MVTMNRYFFLILFTIGCFSQNKFERVPLSSTQSYDGEIKINSEDNVLMKLNSSLRKFSKTLSFFVLSKTSDEYTLIVLDCKDIKSLKKYKSFSTTVSIYYYNTKEEILSCVCYDDSLHLTLTKDNENHYFVEFDARYYELSNVTFYDKNLYGLYTLLYSSAGFIPLDYNGVHEPYLGFNHSDGTCHMVNDSDQIRDVIKDETLMDLYRRLNLLQYSNCEFNYDFIKEKKNMIFNHIRRM